MKKIKQFYSLTIFLVLFGFNVHAETYPNTSIAIVAPGIAEALLATAMGLLAAIPAVIAYNKISSDINRYGIRLEVFLNDFNTILSRQISKK